DYYCGSYRTGNTLLF
nr:immunoglobulin light chain junction region [Macaca mulatta]